MKLFNVEFYSGGVKLKYPHIIYGTNSFVCVKITLDLLSLESDKFGITCYFKVMYKIVMDKIGFITIGCYKSPLK